MPVTTRSQRKSHINNSSKKSYSYKSPKKELFKNLYIKKYKNGLKVELFNSKDNKIWKKPYVKMGNKMMYWNDSMKCWFCSTTCEKYLLEGGAKWFSQKTKSKRTKKISKQALSKPLFTNMKLESYGKGYLLFPKKNHKDFGTKYYHDGWWLKNKQAWFFKKEFHNFLMVNGVIYSTVDNDVLSDYSDDYEELNENLFTGTVVKNYKNGLILKPKKTHPDWGEKYYHNGFWNNTLKSWVFKQDAKDFLVNHGAKLTK